MIAVSRPSLDETFIEVARVMARRSTCSRLNVGAVLVNDGKIVATGFNGAPRKLEHCVHDTDDPCGVSVHAEANVIVNAAYHGNSTRNSEMYVTHAPCRACASLMINAGIQSVVYGGPYRSDDGLTLLISAGLLVRPT